MAKVTHADIHILKGKKHLHFIGIGGSGMYPLVQILHSKGYYITGSDNNETDTLAAERALGIPVFMGQRAQNIEGADLIVYTAAIMADNPELIAAMASDVPAIERSVLLGIVTGQYDNAICVSGTHGKTTTTSMITQILVEANLDPTAVIGGKLPLIGGSGRVGGSDTMVCEACEFVDTFLKLYPDIAVILNVDADHLDYFGTLENIIKSFHKFASNATKAILVNGDDANSLKALEGLDKTVITFGRGEHNDYIAKNSRIISERHTEFELWSKEEGFLTRITLAVPGEHNILNATAAAAASFLAGASPAQAAGGLSHFGGAKRRFEILGQVRGVTIADDYAHHPAEIKVTLEAAKGMHYKKVWAVFQPFTYSRTKMLLDDFASTLAIADRVVLSEIMGSREKNTYNIFAKDLADKIDGCVWFPEFPEIAEYVMSHAEEGDLVITLGCGDVNKCAKMMLEM
ncbi:UDP-N-acetylmuramate--L-alanine ligase [Zongyangia hominis]|uniref:UDP-N-acetylmuramate--L-alanine ligase n=1 Tax=Zongyangia hominis TaxID=2763677 RepID=A0A926EBM6_9FIRM|nr:UDP-N-acetylmuramate--L-alanine ligase [Zongyangia hominis]MBC8570085.1 UDP-N-acetylmuramate--L-alanine ligase [Zongyangia hominis]